jgi:hypothetical protein
MARPRKTPRYGDSEKDLRRAIAKYGSVAVDLETTGLNFHADENSSIGAAIFSVGASRSSCASFPTGGPKSWPIPTPEWSATTCRSIWPG